MNDRYREQLARVAEHNGADILRALTYPGGPRGLYNDALIAEGRLDRMLERAAFARAVLSGDADGFVDAWQFKGLYEARHGEAFCSHCDDLTARLIRAARDAATKRAEKAERQLNRLCWVLRRGLRFAIQRTHEDDPDGPDALVKHAARFFEVVEPAP